MPRIDISNTEVSVHYDQFDDELPIGLEVGGRAEWFTADQAQEIVKTIQKFLGSDEPTSPSLEDRVARLEALALPRQEQATERLLTDLFPPGNDTQLPNGDQPPAVVFTSALLDQDEVTFRYCGAADFEPRRRCIIPTEVNTEKGQVIGYDVDRDGTRCFKFENIEGPVEYT